MCPIFSFVFLSLSQSAVQYLKYIRPIFRSTYVEVLFGVKYQPFPIIPRNVFGARSESRGQPGLRVEQSRAPETREVMEPQRGKVAACPEAEGKETVTRGAGVEEQRYGVFSDRKTDSGWSAPDQALPG